MGAGPWYYLYCNGATTVVDCGSDASLDNRPTAVANFQIEGFFRYDAAAPALSYVIGKGAVGARGWYVFISAINDQLYGAVRHAVGSVSATVAVSVRDSTWHHYVFDYVAGTLTGRLALDGVWGAASAGAGAYQADGADNVILGRTPAGAVGWWLGGLSWHRLSNIQRYTPGVNFVPPSRHALPTVDGNTIEQWPINEGSGTVAYASVVSPNNNGAITAGTWRFE